MFQASVSHHQECANLPVCQPAPLSPTFRTIQVTRDMLLEVHGYLVKYLLYGQIVEFFIIHICIWPDTILLSTYRLSVSGYLANFTIWNYLYPANRQILLSIHPYL